MTTIVQASNTSKLVVVIDGECSNCPSKGLLKRGGKKDELSLPTKCPKWQANKSLWQSSSNTNLLVAGVFPQIVVERKASLWRLKTRQLWADEDH